ncbi:hypothetical protein BT69DRAFT_1390033 [Atractiella rhizophila]|nr:hypothetical protein BT69DRAFT_1390033 [Atractiella rhizophila]
MSPNASIGGNTVRCFIEQCFKAATENKAASEERVVTVGGNESAIEKPAGINRLSTKGARARTWKTNLSHSVLRREDPPPTRAVTRQTRPLPRRARKVKDPELSVPTWVRLFPHGVRVSTVEEWMSAPALLFPELGARFPDIYKVDYYLQSCFLQEGFTSQSCYYPGLSQVSVPPVLFYHCTRAGRREGGGGDCPAGVFLLWRKLTGWNVAGGTKSLTEAEDSAWLAPHAQNVEELTWAVTSFVRDEGIKYYAPTLLRNRHEERVTFCRLLNTGCFFALWTRKDSFQNSTSRRQPHQRLKHVLRRRGLYLPPWSISLQTRKRMLL